MSNDGVTLGTRPPGTWHHWTFIFVHCIQFPTIEWLKTTEIYPTTVLEDRSLKQRCQQDWVLLEGPEGIFVHAHLPVSGGFRQPWCPLTCDHPNLCLHLHMTFSPVSLSLFSSPYKELITLVRMHPIPVWLHLNQLHLQWPYFLIKSYSEFQGGHKQIYILISTHFWELNFGL